MHAAGGPDQARGSNTVDATAPARSPEAPDDLARDIPAPEQAPPARPRGARFPSAARRRRWSEPEHQPETVAVAEDPVAPPVAEAPVAAPPVVDEPVAAPPVAEAPVAEDLVTQDRVAERPGVSAGQPAAATATRPSPRVRATAAAEVAAVAPVRPYVLTRGRTRASHEFALETLVSSSQDPARLGMVDGEEHRAVLVLCVRPRSVVEIAAMLGVPLGVARVLLGDLADIGAVTVHRTVGPGGPDLALMSRVLEGLRRL